MTQLFGARGAPVDQTKWRVASRCINCMAARTMAPDLLREENGRSAFVRQPGTPNETVAAWRALQLCPVGAVEAPAGLEAPADLFPEPLDGGGGGLFRLGHNARSSYGAHSYYAICGDLRLMIDGPGWSPKLAVWMEGQGGLDHVLLTHRDDIADAARYERHFGARVWIHEGDAAGAPFATDVMRGEDPAGPAAAIEVISMPGHTRGSVMFLLDGHTLFTGDSLAWDHERGGLRGYREYCQHSWRAQLASLARLRGRRFARLLAGHGGSVELKPERMQRELDRMLSREGAPEL